MFRGNRQTTEVWAVRGIYLHHTSTTDSFSTDQNGDVFAEKVSPSSVFYVYVFWSRGSGSLTPILFHFSHLSSFPLSLSKLKQKTTTEEVLYILKKKYMLR